MVSDNDGACFDFVKLAQGNTWVTTTALNQVGVNNPALDQSAGLDRRALASIKQTDVLILGILTWPTGVHASPLDVYGRAALYSLGFFLRRAASVRLDVDERELKVGLRVVTVNGQVTGQIFLSDSLENGAGYSSYLGQPAQMQRLLEFIAGIGDTSFNAPIVAHQHASECTTSCPDCLRDFSNLAFHNILDWRLGLDLARLALDPNATIDFTVPYWVPFASNATAGYLATQPSWQSLTLAGIPAGRCASHIEIVTHPLWCLDQNNRRPQLVAAYAQAQATGAQNVTLKSLFDLVRRPYL